MNKQTTATIEDAEQANKVALSSLKEMRMMKKNKKKIKKDHIRSMINNLGTSLEMLSPGNPLAVKARNFLKATSGQEPKPQHPNEQSA